ncbi:molybdopterin-dependent oxidoreductase [Noviherbaspirillum sedimenti]|uniref:Molybdopterin-dependent oxidoreductase n=1 Tax=Noviherbaspirillum sedimenti TaxID=2320865 RepID=A0A3A3GRE7_9BURK|nr:molybdopterin-dependent oxidoreductase [Noviherbaspirillum sedimenti]RJG03530.1 molybdopterin-dependent oxidoreductase [Noviherbaspirillum sedimenti]
MNRRKFLSASSLGLAALPTVAPAQTAAKSAPGPALLTVTDVAVRANRGPLDPALDQMMHKQGIKFDKAHTFDFAAIAALPAVSIKPTLEYDARPHTLSGPLLSDVVTAAGAPDMASARLLLRAVDGYAVVISLADARKYRFIVATHLDGRPMPLGGLGPLWAVYDADRFPGMAAKPLNQRFTLCPWALYHIDVLSATPVA